MDMERWEERIRRFEERIRRYLGDRFPGDWLRRYRFAPYLLVGGGAFLVLTLLVSTFRSWSTTPRTRPSLPSARPEIIAFYQRGYGEQDRGYPSLERQSRYFHTLSPFWYTALSNGDVVPYQMEEEAKNLARQRGLRLVPLVNKGPGYGMITDPQARRKLAQGLRDIVMKEGYDGINIDFQPVPPAYRDHLTATVREISRLLHPEGKTVAVSVMPQAEMDPSASGGYDYGGLAAVSDYLVIMAYDRHRQGTPPGSVAPYDWVEKNVRYAVSRIGPQKTVLGLASYGYDWPQGRPGGESLGLDEALSRASIMGAEIRWHAPTRSSYFSYSSDRGPREVWIEGGDAVQHKAALARKYKLRGVAVWRLGYDTDYYWQKLREGLFGS